MNKVQEGQAGDVRINRANTLRYIGRLCYHLEGVALPAPNNVAFQPDTNGERTCLRLVFDSAEDAQAWAEHLEVTYPRERTYQPDWHDGPIRSYSAHAKWRGYSVSISGWTAVTQ